MPKNKNVHQMDPTQCQKLAFDGEHDAFRFIPALDSAHSISIKAEDGDSIESVARTQLVVPSHGAIDCSRMRKLCGYDLANCSVSPDGISWFPIALENGVVLDLCAIQIKVSNGQVVMRS